MAEEKKAEEQPAAGKPSRKKLIIIGAIVAVLAVGGGVGGVMLKGGHKGDGETAAAGKTGEAAAEAGGEHKPVTYLPLDPAFVVNFQPAPNGEKPRAKFLSVELQAVAGDAAMSEEIKTHLPAIRNSVIMLLSRQTYDVLITPEGKEKLRGEVKEEIQKVLKKETGKPGIEDVYFTSFVMQ